MKGQGPERVGKAAITHGRLISTGIHHGEAALKMDNSDGGSWWNSNVEGREGFVTTTGRIVDRKEAFRLAVKSKQKQRTTDQFGVEAHTGDLSSEDIEHTVPGGYDKYK